VNLLKDIIIHPQAFFLDEEICLIKDFLPEEIFNSILEITNNATVSDWDKFNPNSNGQWAHNILEFNNELSKIVGSLIKKVFNGEPYDFSCNFIRRNRHGQDLLLHYDRQSQKSCEYGLVLYLNDNYEGGEIYYPNRSIEYKPIKNSLVVHSSSEEYTHGVKTVNGNSRYYITLWAFYNNKELGF